MNGIAQAPNKDASERVQVLEREKAMEYVCGCMQVTYQKDDRKKGMTRKKG